MTGQEPTLPPGEPADHSGAPPTPPTGLSPIPLERLRGGDRQAAAQYIARNASLIRRRLRGKIAQDLRRLFDSDDLMATISRRLDEIVSRHELVAASEAEFWSLLDRLAMNALTDVARRSMHENPGDSDDGEPTEAPNEGAPAVELKPVPDDPDALVNLILTTLEHEPDQRMLRMRLERRTHEQIAAAEGLSVPAARKRWQRIRRAVRAVLTLILAPARPRPPAYPSAPGSQAEVKPYGTAAAPPPSPESPRHER